MNTKLFTCSVILLLGILISSCTDRNNNGTPDMKDGDENDEDNYGVITNDSSSQGSENYPGNSKGVNTEDKRYGADPEISKSDTVMNDSVNNKR
jgi:hypothetical protein